ncbi:hypothetical protein L0337_32825 [candidate division KSB1 bacterium]|nr:hypothetical protein [candidate division KSB1 bacterium]
MKSRRTKLADLRAMHFLRRGFTQESGQTRVDIKDPVVGILIRPYPTGDRLSIQTTFLKCFIRLDGGGPRLSPVLAWQKLGAWIIRVGGEAQHHNCWNTT